MIKIFDRRQVAHMALESMMDRVETAMPDIGDDFPELAEDPLSVKYVHGCVETAMALIQRLSTRWLMDDLYSVLCIESEIKALYPCRLKRHESLVALEPVPVEAAHTLHAIVGRMMARLETAGVFEPG